MLKQHLGKGFMVATSSGLTPQRILILDNGDSSAPSIVERLSFTLPETEVREASSIEAYREALQSAEFDIVVLDYDLPAARDMELLAQLRVRDHEPDVLLVSKCEQVETIRKIAESRKRYVVRDEKWIDSVVLALRDMIRIRRLEREMAAVQEQLMVANAKLEEKNRRLDDFCATIAHDIRGPLAGLILKTEYIVDTYHESLDDRCVTLLKRSADSANRLVGIVQGMYEFAKIGAGTIRFEEVDLALLVSEVLGDLHIDDSLEVQVGLGKMPQVWGAPNLLRRVFINLISNSIKFNDKDEVRLNIGCDGDVIRDGVRYARVYVEDNGPGISPDDVSNIFAMFHRGRSHKDQTDGLGIGLAVVQRIIELHNGEVGLSSRPGSGCRFSFLIPSEKSPGVHAVDVLREASEAEPATASTEVPEVTDAGPIRHLRGRV